MTDFYLNYDPSHDPMDYVDAAQFINELEDCVDAAALLDELEPEV